MDDGVVGFGAGGSLLESWIMVCGMRRRSMLYLCK